MKKSMMTVLVAIMMLVCITANAADWETDFSKAAATAKSTGKYMLLDFSGSDWCGWCKKLEAEVFSQSAFQTFAEENLVCVLLDFPRGKPQSKQLKQQNAGLAKKYEIMGYPTVIILNPEGEFVEQTGYQAGGAQNYVEHLKTIINTYKIEKGKR